MRVPVRPPAMSTAFNLAQMVGYEPSCLGLTEPLADTCERHARNDADRGGISEMQGSTRYDFADGSSMIIRLDGWDFGYRDCTCHCGTGIGHDKQCPYYTRRSK